MSSSAAKRAAGASITHGQEVITLLDSDSEGDGSPALSTSTSGTALKSTNDGARASFVPFHLYETTTAKSEFRTTDGAKKYFRTLREIIGIDNPRRKFQWMIIFNFLIDFSYLLEKLLPEILQFHRLVVFYGSAADTEAMDQWRQLLSGTGNTVEFIQLIPSDPPRSRTNPLPIKIPYGVHHTKMFLMGYEENNQSNCRVVVHTANLLLGDIEYKTQGAYCQDFPLKKFCNDGSSNKASKVNPYKRKRDQSRGEKKDTTMGNGWPFDEDNVPFEEDLVTYLESYRYLTRQSWCRGSHSSKNSLSNKPMSWLQLIRQYNYSNAYGVLIPSAPGKHKPDSYHNFGYLKLRQAILEWVCPHLQKDKQSSHPPILCQFSSIGSLNGKWLDEFLSAVDSWSTQNYHPISTADEKKGKKRQPLSSRMKIIWPTMDEIRTSIEGYRGGASVPGKIQNLSKDFLQPLYHRWSSENSKSNNNNIDPLKTSRHIPHIKTFVQPSSSDGNGIEWIVLTSHNLSIAAWGQMQKASAESAPDDKILFIRHWELGVFISPATISNLDLGAIGNNICMTSLAGVGNNNAVINIDRDGAEDESQAQNILVPLPFDMNPTPYNKNDIAWACDRSCSVTDAFGCFMP